MFNVKLEVYAAENKEEPRFLKSKNSNEEDIKIKIMECIDDAGISGEIDVLAPISIYNCDMCEFINIYPIFINDKAVMMAYADSKGANISLSYDISIFTSLKTLSNEDYILYIDDGVYYAECEKGTQELSRTKDYYDNGNDEFDESSYSEKIEYLEIIEDKDCIFEDIQDENYASNDKLGMNYTLVSKVSSTINGVASNLYTCNIKKFVSQNDRGLCWAASVATIVNYKVALSNLSAENVADKMKIGYDRGGTLTDIRSALYKYGINYNITYNKLPWNTVKINISRDKPFVIALKKENIGHAITAYGYACDSNGYKILFYYSAPYVYTSGYVFNWVATVY